MRGNVQDAWRRGRAAILRRTQRPDPCWACGQPWKEPLMDARDAEDYRSLLRITATTYERITGGMVSKPFTDPVAVAQLVEERFSTAEEKAETLIAALLSEEQSLWDELPHTAARTIPGGGVGRWSMETDWQIERIENIARLVGLTHPDDLPRMSGGLRAVYERMALQYPTAQAVEQ